MSNASVGLKLCPFCAEEIKLAAIVCKHCSRDLPTTIGAPAQIKEQSVIQPEVPSTPVDESCWDCGFVQLGSEGLCVNCGVELNAEKYLASTPSSADSTWTKAPMVSVIAFVAFVLAVVAGVWWFVSGLDPNRTSLSAEQNYPVATTVREAAAYAVATYCSDAPNGVGDPNNWMSMGGTSAFINTGSGRVTLNASLPGADGSPGEVTATDSLSKEALEAWNCQKPMFVKGAGG